MTAGGLAAAAEELLSSGERMARMRADLAAVRAALLLEGSASDPLTYAASEIIKTFGRQ